MVLSGLGGPQDADLAGSLAYESTFVAYHTAVEMITFRGG
jgi:hypothetical protein